MSSWLIVVIRSILLIFLTLFLIRINGNTTLSNMRAFHLVSNMAIAFIAALISLNIITSFYLGVTALLLWGLCPAALDFLAGKSKRIYNVVNGREKVLIKSGKVMENNLNKAKLTGEDLLSALRSKNIFNLADVEFAVMETTGDINVSLKSDKKPVTSHDLGQKVGSKAEAQLVILEGKILNEGLNDTQLNQEWLKTQLDIKGVTLENVFIGQVDSSGDLYLDIYDDKIQVPQSQLKEMLYANIQKTQADLMSYALETENKKAKEMYLENAEKMKKVMERLEPYLLR